jgi:hypothetical protein
MTVSLRETKVVQRCRHSLVHAVLLFVTVFSGTAPAQESRFFRIGTAATGGSFFEIGGIVAGAISSPIEGPTCERGGSCGVPGLVAVAIATPGSLENLRQVAAGQIDSGFAQADLAGWAYNGTKVFAEGGPLRRLRAIASLFPEAAHLVVRADSPIKSIADLAGKNVSLGELGSGSTVGAQILLSAAGFKETDIGRKYLRPGRAGEELKAGTIDAFFLIGGYPVPAIRDLAATIPLRLVPIEGPIVDALKHDFKFYGQTTIPGGIYPGIDGDTPSLGFSALWVVNADINDDLVYAITQSLWRPATARLLAGLDPIGKRIRIERALDGISVPLHPGAARFYREAGMSTEGAPEASVEPDKSKQPIASQP